jgi:hypothetical protein
MGLDFRAAVATLAAEAGLSPRDDTGEAERRRREAERRRKQQEAGRKRQQERELARRHAWAARTAAQASPPLTPDSEGERLVAQLYLGIHRAVPNNAPYPTAISYHPGRNALIAIATNSNGKITGGQFIYFDDAGHRLTKDAAVARGFRAPKETFGVISGSVVHLPRRDRAWVYSLMPVRFIAESVARPRQHPGGARPHARSAETCLQRAATSRRACLYQEQRRQTADIWFVAHQTLYRAPPKPFRPHHLR